MVIRKKLIGEDDYDLFSIRVPAELHQKLQKLANECGRSRNAVIGEILSQGVDAVVVE